MTVFSFLRNGLHSEVNDPTFHIVGIVTRLVDEEPVIARCEWAGIQFQFLADPS